MAVPVEAFTVLLLNESIQRYLDEGASTLQSIAPNDTLVTDGEISRLSFMMAVDADAFCALMHTHGFRSGVDMSIVTSEQIDTHSEDWLVLAPFERAVIAALRGSQISQVFATEGWSPLAEPRLERLDDAELAQYEMVSEANGVSTWRHRRTGEVRYSASPDFPHVSLFQQATALAGSLVQLAGPTASPLSSQQERMVREAIGMLDEAVVMAPHYWQALWFLGKFHQRLGDEASSLDALRRSAHACGSENVDTWREYAAACARVGAVDEGISAAEMATEIEPGNAGLISNLALAHLLAGNLTEAQDFIRQADLIDPGHPVTQGLAARIEAVSNGNRPQPTTMADLTGQSTPSKRRWGRRQR